MDGYDGELWTLPLVTDGGGCGRCRHAVILLKRGFVRGDFL